MAGAPSSPVRGVHRRGMGEAGERRISDHQRSLQRRHPCRGCKGQCRGRGSCRGSCAEGSPRLAGVERARAGTLSLCAGASGAEALPPAGGIGDDGQRQTHPGEPGHRYSPGGEALLPPCRLGAVAGVGVSQLHGLWRGGPGHPVEFSAADVCLEGGPSAGRGQHGGHQAGEIYATDRFGVRRVGHGGWSASGRTECAHVRRQNRPGTARASRDRQDRLHRLDGGGPHHPQGHRAIA